MRFEKIKTFRSLIKSRLTRARVYEQLQDFENMNFLKFVCEFVEGGEFLRMEALLFEGMRM